MPRSGPLSSEERRAYELGRRCFQSGEDSRALRALEGLLGSRQEFADVHYMVGVLLERQERRPEALRSFQQALRINPDYAEARLAVASLLEQQGDYDRAREITGQARLRAGARHGSLDPTTRAKLANLQAALADAHREAGDLREAIEIYRKALDRCPHFHDVRQRLGIALREAGLPHRALAEFRRVQRERPDYLDAAVQAGLTLYTLGKSDDALQEWREALALDPSRSDAAMYTRMVETSRGRAAIPAAAPGSRPPARRGRA